VIRNRFEAPNLRIFFKERKISPTSMSIWVFQKAPRGYNPKSELFKLFLKEDETHFFKKYDRHVRVACTHPVVFYFLVGLRFLKNLSNSDFGKCRDITVTSTIEVPLYYSVICREARAFFSAVSRDGLVIFRRMIDDS
jgi:hypothetical protein